MKNAPTLDSDDEKTYVLTPFGLLGPATHAAIIATMRRNGSNAIVLNGEDLEWATVEKAS
jgi:hypothetical protein